MLYSFKGQFPQVLPNRIILSNGLSRTDKTTFTPEEILDAGYIKVDDPPVKTNMYQVVTWSGTQWDIQDSRDLNLAIQYRLEDLSRLRREKETEFYFNGVSIYLDETTQARINAAVAGFAFRPEEIISWEVARGVFVEFDKNTMEALAVAAWTHVKECYENVKRLTLEIQACTTIEQVDNINLNTGWPEY